MEILRPGLALATLAALSLHSAALAAALGKPKDITFRAKIDGSEQRYVEMLPEGFDAKQEHHLMIALHGCGSDRWQYVRDARGECRGARDVAAKYEMVYVSPDYRATGSWMGPKAEADVLQIIRDVRHRYKIGKVFVVGGSMGGSAAFTFAALHPDVVDGVCSENGMANYLLYENYQDLISASFGGTKSQVPAEYKKRSGEYWPERFTMPLAITVGGKDTAVPPDSAVRLAGAVKQIGGRVMLIERPETGHETSYEDTIAALDWVVRTALGRAEGS